MITVSFKYFLAPFCSMGRFGRSHYREERQKRGEANGKASPRKYRAEGPFSYVLENGRGSSKLGLSYRGREKFADKLRIIRERKKAMEKSLARTKRHALLKTLFRAQKPISFKTKDGKRIRILRTGFENIFLGQDKIPPRAFIITLVNGKILYFYRSSGERSKMAGEWFPTSGPYVYYPSTSSKGEKTSLGHLGKLEGHPISGSRNPRFAPWVEEIRAKIKANEHKILLQKNWGADEYLQIREALGKIPRTEEIKSSEY